jgi:5'-nucleotidase
MKILFIGIITEEVLSKVAGDKMISTFVWIQDAAREVEKICNSYKAVDIDFTVLLTHIGYENDIKMAKLLNPELWVDVIIWWHSHTLLEKPTKVNDIQIVQVGVWTDQIWRFDIKVDTKDNNIEEFTRKSIPITPENCPRNLKLEQILNWYKWETDKKYGRILSKMKRDLTHPKRENESEVWNLFTDIFKECLWLDMMCLGAGSLRNKKLDSIVTLWELKEMYPYWWPIVSVKITGKDIKNMKRYKKLTILHSNDMHGDFFAEEENTYLHIL